MKENKERRNPFEGMKNPPRKKDAEKKPAANGKLKNIPEEDLWRNDPELVGTVRDLMYFDKSKGSTKKIYTFLDKMQNIFDSKEEFVNNISSLLRALLSPPVDCAPDGDDDWDDDDDEYEDWDDDEDDDWEEDVWDDDDEFRPVTTNEWQLTHPFQLSSGSDEFYADIASQILESFEELYLAPGLPRGVIRTSAKAAAAYLEDIISETNIWQSVRSLYRKRYDRILPFYDVNPDDYYTDDLNVEDLKLLVWQSFCRCGKYYGRTFSPFSQAVEKMAETAFEILVDNFDDAPTAKRIRDKLKSVFRSGDYFQLRTLGLWLTADSPLTAIPFLREDMMQNVEKVMTEDYSDKLEGMDAKTAYYFEEARLGWSQYMSILGCGSNVLLSEIARIAGHDALADKLLKISPIGFDDYVIEEVKGKYVYLRNRANRQYKVVKDSFGKGVDWNALDAVMCMLYRFGEDCMQNGVASFLESKPLWYGKEKTNIDEKDIYIRSEIPDEFKEKIDELIKKNRGRQIYYCKMREEVQKILSGVMELRAYDSKTNEFVENPDEADNYLLMLSSETTPIMLEDDCIYFKDAKNPFYLGRDIPEKDMGGYMFIYNTVLPDDLIDYIEERKMLPNAYINASQGKRFGKKIVQENLGFLMRFNRVPGFPAPF